MASSVYRHSYSTYMHNGPRQGVYPLQQLQHYRAVSWRASQLRHPDTCYRHKIRTEPAEILPGPPSLPSHTIKRSSSATSMNTQAVGKPKTAFSKDSSRGSECVLTTAPMTLQTRPSLKSRSTPPSAKCHPPSEDYPYLDPLKVNGDPCFEERLAEMAQHEANTIHREEWDKSKRISSRPSTARSVSKSYSSQSFPTSASRPTSARSTTSTTSARQRKSSTSSVTAPSKKSHHSSNGVKPSIIHASSSDIHKSRSAIELKQTGANSRDGPLPKPPSDNKNKTLFPLHDSPSNQNSTDLPPQLSEPIQGEQLSKDEQEFSIPLAKARSSQASSDSEDTKTDDLNATSDLGLSIESLQSSGEDDSQKGSVGQPTDTDKSSVPLPVSFKVLIDPPKKSKRHRKKS